MSVEQSLIRIADALERQTKLIEYQALMMDKAGRYALPETQVRRAQMLTQALWPEPITPPAAVVK